MMSPCTLSNEECSKRSVQSSVQCGGGVSGSQLFAVSNEQFAVTYPALPQHLPQAVGVGFFSSFPSSSFTLSSSFFSFASLLPLHIVFPLLCFPSQLLLFILIFLRFTPNFSCCPSISFPLLPFPLPSPPFSSYLYLLQIYIILPTLKHT